MDKKFKPPAEKESKPEKSPINWKKKWETTKVVASKTATTSVSFLNGAVGDHLERLDLGISLDMNFYKEKKPIEISRENLKDIKFGSKICILIHGLVSNETMWKYADLGEDYGSLLQKDLKYYPLYARYNSGRHISENGKDLDTLIESLLKCAEKPIKEIVFICHSMGGLVTRSACFYGAKRKSKWVGITKKIIFIGAPHHGAPLEKFSNIVTSILGKIPNPFTRLTKKVINLRSAGIKDLRYGYLVEEDWKDKDPDSYVVADKVHVPLLAHTKYYVITGTLTQNPNHILADFFGDAMVGKWSAQGKSGNPKYNLSFAEKHIRELPGITHLRLMNDNRVYEQIRVWLS